VFCTLLPAAAIVSTVGVLDKYVLYIHINYNSTHVQPLFNGVSEYVCK